MKVPFISFEETNRRIREEVMQSFAQFFDSEYFILGSQVHSFETAYSDFNEVEYCIGTGNGLDALEIALRCLDIGVGDEVIVPANTHFATALAVSHVGARPVLVEPDPDTCNLDPGGIEAAISSSTKAIMPVHLYGLPCEMDRILAVARKHGLYVVEDNAQAQGARFQGGLTGSFGNINATSFYPTKNLGALGDAGAITTNDESLAEKARQWRNYGSKAKNVLVELGINSRLDEVQAGLLTVKLKYLLEWTEERQRLAALYREQLDGLENFVLPHFSTGAVGVFHLFVIRTPYRDQLQVSLRESGIETLIHYPTPFYLQEAYVELGHKKGDFPITEKMAAECLSLPLFIGMKAQQVTYVCEMIRSFFGSI